MAHDKVGENSLVCYAAAGEVVEPASEKLSPLAAALAAELPKSRGNTAEFLRDVVDRVKQRTKDAQTPWVKSTLPNSHNLHADTASRAISPPEAFREGRKAGEEWVNARGMVFCWCPPGTFTMGSPPDSP